MHRTGQQRQAAHTCNMIFGSTLSNVDKYPTTTHIKKSATRNASNTMVQVPGVSPPQQPVSSSGAGVVSSQQQSKWQQTALCTPPFFLKTENTEQHFIAFSLPPHSRHEFLVQSRSGLSKQMQYTWIALTHKLKVQRGVNIKWLRHLWYRCISCQQQMLILSQLSCSSQVHKIAFLRH